MPDAERHAIELAHNTIDWLLHQNLTHPGLWGHLTSAQTQLDACQKLAIPPGKEAP